MKTVGWLLAVLLLIAGCSGGSGGSDAAATSAPRQGWVDDDVTFTDSSTLGAGLTMHGTYRHDASAASGPAALLISESGNTDRNGDNAVAGPIGNMRQLAEYLSSKGIATLRYDKVGTGKTGIGPYATHPNDVGSAVYDAGAKAAIRYLAAQPATDRARISVYGLGEGTVHAVSLGADTAPDAPKVHSLGLFQPLSGRYLDMTTARVRSGLDADVKAGAKTPLQAADVMTAWNAAVVEARTKGTAPATLPEGLTAILSPVNVKAVVEADAIDPLASAAALPAGMPVLATCSDSDVQGRCDAVQPMFAALAHTALTVVELKGVNHVLRYDPSDNVGNYAKQDPLAPQLVTALDGFVGR